MRIYLFSEHWLLMNVLLGYLFNWRFQCTQDKITKQWQNDNLIVQSKVTKYIKIKSQTQKCMSSSWGPAGVTSLKWKLCHKSIIQQDDWQIRRVIFLGFIVRKPLLLLLLWMVSISCESKRKETLTWLDSIEKSIILLYDRHARPIMKKKAN